MEISLCCSSATVSELGKTHHTRFMKPNMDCTKNVPWVKIEGPGAGIPSIIIYLSLKGFVQTPLLINQPKGKGHLWMVQKK